MKLRRLFSLAILGGLAASATTILPIQLATGVAAWQVRGGICPSELLSCMADPSIWTTAVVVQNPGSVEAQPGILPGVTWPTGPAAWITKATDANGLVRSGTLRYDFGYYIYEFQISFDLTGYNPSLLSLNGHVWADGQLDGTLKGGLAAGAGLAGIWLNDLSSDIGNSQGPPISWLYGTDFGFDGGFRPGMNTLTFRVLNRGHEVGLRVDEVFLTQTPEPATWVLVGMGAIVLGLVRRRGIS